ncbi:MAG: S1/P1 nuclease [Bacteroidota bacterium]
MRKGFISLIFLVSTFQIQAWGTLGHRIVGLIAEQHLTKKAKKSIRKVAANETLAEMSTFMDFIKSDPSYKHMSPWHYATIPDGKSYDQAGTPKEKDVIVTIRRLISELERKEFTDENELFALRCLVHLVGDLHQPLHVGTGVDKGGNTVKLSYFWGSSNLHRVWDSGIIDQQQYSYTEYADWINHPTEQQLQEWSSLDVLDWANESATYRKQCYETMPENGKLTYSYNFDNIELVNQRLLQAGIRLANVLNEIYG